MGTPSKEYIGEDYNLEAWYQLSKLRFHQVASHCNCFRKDIFIDFHLFTASPRKKKKPKVNLLNHNELITVNEEEDLVELASKHIQVKKHSDFFLNSVFSRQSLYLSSTLKRYD